MDIDSAKNKFDQLKSDWEKGRAKVDTEQDTRFQMIDQVLVEVLGWPRFDIQTESHVESGYADYLLKIADRPKFVVEAKRAGKILLDTKKSTVSAYQADGAALKSASDGLKQANNYCFDTGAPFAALTSGFEWIAYWAIRSDGMPARRGKTIVFPCLESISDNFALFFDLFSPDGVQDQRYQIVIHEKEGLAVQAVEKLDSVISPSEVKMLKISPLSKDLETVFRGFFSTISSEDDLDMLSSCFVESKESREADVSLEKIAKNLINKIDVVEPAKGGELESRLRDAIELNKAEFVLIIGNKGAGKSTFIERFFRLVLDKKLTSRCLLVRVNLANSDGDRKRIGTWLTERLIREIELALFDNGRPTFKKLQGVFYSEYQRWRSGEHQPLYERDRQEFKEKFGEWIRNLIDDKPEKYLRHLLRNAVSSRKLMPCLIFDNTDHFPQDFQEQVFQFAQSIHSAVFSFMICPITDRTIWQLSKSGPFQSYDTTAFYLPVPSTKDVLKKRVSYLKNVVSSGDQQTAGEYLLSKGIRVKINDLEAFAACIDDVFIHTDYISRTVGWLSNHDIRRSLKLAERIILSPFIGIDDLVKIFLSKKTLNVERRRISKALFLGDYNQFNQTNSELVLNLFEVNPENLSSPLLRLSILRLLMDKEFSSTQAESAYVTVEQVQNYFESMGANRSLVVHDISLLLEYRLVEPYDPSTTDVTDSLKVRVTHSGQIHYEFAQNDFVYMQCMAQSTSVRRTGAVDGIKKVLQRSGKRTRNDWDEIKRVFAEYLLKQDSIFLNVPEMDAYRSQKQLRQDFESNWANIGD